MSHIRRKIDHLLFLLSISAGALFMYLVHYVLLIRIGNVNNVSDCITAITCIPIGSVVARFVYVITSGFIDENNNEKIIN